MARPRAGIVYIGIKSTVTALDRRTGMEVWRTPLKSGVGRSSSFVTLHRDGDVLYAGVGGALYALDPKTGTVLWTNPLKGLGVGFVTLAGTSGAGAATGQAASAAATAAMTAAVVAAT